MANVTVASISLFIFLSFAATAQKVNTNAGNEIDIRVPAKETSQACVYIKMFQYSETDTIARQIIVRILDLISLPVNFSIEPCDGIKTCLAYVHDNGVRYIFYDRDYMKTMSASSSNNWPLIAVLAHELGHHLCGHTSRGADNDLQRENELQADKFAGAILARMGASSEQSYQSLLLVKHPACEEDRFHDHPCFDKRKKAVLDGFNSIKPSQRDSNFRLSKELADVYIEDNSVVVSAGIVDLSNPKNPPRDQGNEASIVGFSVASALEIEITRKFGYAVQISPRYIYNSIGGTAHSGARIEDALDLAKNIGVIEESVWPYASNDYHNMISKLRADTTSNRYKIQAFYPLKPGSTEQFKKVLKQGSSIIAGIRLPDYFSSDVSGNWRLRGSSFNYAGSISICIVGYDDATKRFKFKNSWGANWGDEGYGYLRYDDLFIILHSAYYLEM